MSLPTLRSAMTTHPHSIRIDETVATARKLMSRLGVRHLPVLKAGVIVGVISERDLRLVFGNDARISVEDVCVEDVVSVDVDTPLHHVAEQMAERRLGSVLVTEHGKLCGIFTTTDACRALVDALRPVAASPLASGGAAW